ncbi:MAG: transcription termination/antitermination protein NusG [Acidimicrobiales bacterium]|nr:transcription termination/antitermination protein NusG [Acidimicrobiales bacterium]
MNADSADNQPDDVTPDDGDASGDAPVAATDLLPTGTLVLDPSDDGPEAASEAAGSANESQDEPVVGEPTEVPVAEESTEAPVVEDHVAEVVDEDALLQGVPGWEKDEGPAPVKESAYDRRGNWYVVHTQSGYEKKVRQNLQARMTSMNLEDRILEVEIPMEDVDEFRNGKKVTVSKKVFPGYLLVRCYLDDEAWSVIRDTPGIVNFVGAGGKPSRLSRKEVETFLPVADESETVVPKRSKARFGFGVGETVRVKEGPFADFSGAIQEINEDQLKVKVLVNIFGRETPVELEFAQVAQL